MLATAMNVARMVNNQVECNSPCAVRPRSLDPSVSTGWPGNEVHGSEVETFMLRRSFNQLKHPPCSTSFGRVVRTLPHPPHTTRPPAHSRASRAASTRGHTSARPAEAGRRGSLLNSGRGQYFMTVRLSESRSRLGVVRRRPSSVARVVLL